MAEDRLVVVLDGAVAADLVSSARGLVLSYRPEWVDDPTSTPVSVSMPTRVGEHRGEVVEAYLWGLLPDDERVVQRWARAAECSARDVFGLLAARGSDVAGSLRFLPPDVDVPTEPAGLEPLDDGQLAASLRDLAVDRPAWNVPGEPGRWSLAGAQAKIVLSRTPDDSGWARAIGSEPTTHILKPAPATYPDLDVNEHVCVATARALGLPAPRTWIETVGGQRTLVVARYDRQVTPDGVVSRVHQEDLCQALGVRPEQKYQADGGPTIAEMAACLRQVVVDEADAQVRALCRALAYDWIVLAPDTHGKNRSLLLSGRQVRLAPIYDVASGAPYYHPKKLKLAQKVGGEYRMARLGGRHWDRLAAEVGVEPEWMRQTVADLADRLPDALHDVIEASNLQADPHRAARHLQDELVAWAAQCAGAVDRS